MRLDHVPTVARHAFTGSPLSPLLAVTDHPPYTDDRPGPETGGRPSLRLLVQGLGATEVAKLMAFLRIGRERLGCEWVIVHDGAAHVLVYGGPEPETLPGIVDDPLEMRRVSDAGHPMPTHAATLVRPLQYDVVIDTLLDAERKCSARPVPAATLQPGARYRLRRWPAADWVQRSRDHLRVASFLSTRHVEIDELARLANVGVTQCGEAVTALIASGVLDVKPPVAADAGAVAPTAASRPRSAPAPGLLNRIRRKLGLSFSS